MIPTLRYRDARAAMRWLREAFGCTPLLVVPGQNGSISHAQLALGEGIIMLASASDDTFGRWQQPPVDGVGTQSPYVVVDDADVLHAQAVRAGAEMVIDIEDQSYGGRGFTCRDPEGFLWNFGTYDPWRLEPIYHITSVDEANRGLSAGEYFPSGFSAEGFTHCSFVHQVVPVANTRYRARSDLVLLEIDRSRVVHRVVIENSHGGDEVFPHIYGGLTRDSVIRRHPFPVGFPDGTFVLPGSVSGLES